MGGPLPAVPSLAASDLLAGPGLAHERDRRLVIEEGRIAAVEATTPASGGPRRLAMPAPVNAHDHARPLSLTSFGAGFLPLEAWLPRSALATPPEPYLAAAAPLARAARGGCAAVMVHYTRPSGLMPMLEEAREVARAARDVGVRLTFALAVRDRNPLVYGPSDEVLGDLPAWVRSAVTDALVRPALPPVEYVALTEAIAEAIEGPLTSVQFGPAAPQWCSDALLEAIAERSAATGRRVHMHLLETAYQRAWADRAYPGGLVRHLAAIGLLSPRLTLAHCVHATPEELDLIAEAGATIVTNLSSNLHIRSGIGPLRAMRERGCRCGVGLDGLAFDEDDDLLREVRLVSALSGPWGFTEPGERRAFLAGVIAEGRASLGAPGTGALAPGEPADLLELDLDALDRDALLPVDPVDLVMARATSAHVARVVVDGRVVVEGGRVLGVDLPGIEAELRARYRAALDGAPLLAAWPRYEAALRRWYAERVGCG